MKKEIDGVLCDTLIDEKIDGWDNGLNKDDLRWFKETLYKTDAGDFYLLCQGHIESKHGPKVVVKNEESEACIYEEIKRITNVRARKWCEEHGKHELVQKYFSAENFND